MPAPSDISQLDAAALVQLYRRKELSPVDVVDDALARIERFEPMINAFVFVDADGARTAARESEARWMIGEPKGLADGLPTTIKDLVEMSGFPTRMGSRTTSDSPGSRDAPAVARLREEGAVFLGKTTLPEFGWIGACHSPLTGITRNPWNLDRTTGGSSGGAAAAALLNLGVLHHGTDAAGSIRIPAAFTGVFGFKPSYGRVPAYPASAMTVLAHQGPLARNVRDAAMLLSILSRPDARDSTAWNTPAPDFRIGLDEGVQDLRIAWSPRLGYVETIDPDVEAAVAKAAQTFTELGARVEEVDPGIADPTKILLTIWYATSAAVIFSMSAEDRAKLDPGYLAIGEQGRRYSLNDYLQAHNRRAEFRLSMLRFHEQYDLLLTPQMPVAAIEAGRVTPADGRFGEDWIHWSPYTYPFNLTQQPAASIPCGFSDDGLPVALQIVGPPRRDDLVLRAARAFESVHPIPTLAEPRR
jgi:aspartyl-tRNA(Asn)/glutamyl-tRNA(Gln) amidotransferase subunit A